MGRKLTTRHADLTGAQELDMGTETQRADRRPKPGGGGRQTRLSRSRLSENARWCEARKSAAKTAQREITMRNERMEAAQEKV
jgi:hypothetical protein